MAIEKAPDRAGRERGAVLAMERIGEFDYSDIHIGRNSSQDHVAIGLDVMRSRITALRQRFGTPSAR